MRYAFSTISSLVAVAVLSACVQETGTAAQLPTVPPPGAPPFITTFDASVSDAAVRACVNALDAQTDGEVRLVGTEFSQANSGVFMRVGTNGAPWRCLVSNDGRSPELMFMGSEGAL